MKKLLLILTLFSWLVSAKGQTQWEMADTAVSTLDGSCIFITVDQNNTPYVVYMDSYNKANVKKFNGSQWVTVGNSGFSAGGTMCTTMAFDNYGTPYVAYSDDVNGQKATVMKFDGNNWVTVGVAGFTQSAATYTSIAIDQNGTPYITFRDVYHNYGASVMKFDGSNWVYVGTPGFSHPVNDYGGALYTAISIDKNGILYVAYSDFSNGFQATVQKFDGNDWVYVGAHGFASWNATNTKSMAFDKNGTPYIICSVANKATVMKFDGNNWMHVGSSASIGKTEGASIALDANDTVYVAYTDFANGKKATVMKFDGTNWINVGLVGFSGAEVYYTTLAIDKLGNLYVAYRDSTPYNFNGWDHYRAKAMKFGNKVTGIKDTPSSSSFSVYPNPTNGVFNIQYEDYKAVGTLQLTVRSIQGTSVYKDSITDFNRSVSRQINLQNLSKGTYFIELNTPQKREVKKIIIE